LNRVDFYLLSTGNEEARLLTACKIVDKAWGQGLKIFVNTDGLEQASQMDDLLWTFKQDSFVPHELVAPDNANDAPVVIGQYSNGDSPRDILVNVASTLPSLEGLPERVAEVVASDDEGRAVGRNKYRHYRQQGCELLTHEL
jgi:DNA polymerase III subunit chi